jgi:hypothetical protein
MVAATNITQITGTVSGRPAKEPATDSSPWIFFASVLGWLIKKISQKPVRLNKKCSGTNSNEVLRHFSRFTVVMNSGKDALFFIFYFLTLSLFSIKVESRRSWN